MKKQLAVDVNILRLPEIKQLLRELQEALNTIEAQRLEIYRLCEAGGKLRLLYFHHLGIAMSLKEKIALMESNLAGMAEYADVFLPDDDENNPRAPGGIGYDGAPGPGPGE